MKKNNLFRRSLAIILSVVMMSGLLTGSGFMASETYALELAEYEADPAFTDDLAMDEICDLNSISADGLVFDETEDISADNDDADDWYFDELIDEDAVQITGYKGNSENVTVPNKFTVPAAPSPVAGTVTGPKTYDNVKIVPMNFHFDNPERIKSFTISSGVKASACEAPSFVSNLINIKSLDLSGLDYSGFSGEMTLENVFENLTHLENVLLMKNIKTRSTAFMFDGCLSLKSIDISGIDVSEVTDSRSMFNGCSSLTTIYVDKTTFSRFGNPNATPAFTSDDMFKECASLEGGRGTSYSPQMTDATYARIDKGSSEPGYFTDKNRTPSLVDPYSYSLSLLLVIETSL